MHPVLRRKFFNMIIKRVSAPTDCISTVLRRCSAGQPLASQRTQCSSKNNPSSEDKDCPQNIKSTSQSEKNPASHQIEESKVAVKRMNEEMKRTLLHAEKEAEVNSAGNSLSDVDKKILQIKSLSFLDLVDRSALSPEKLTIHSAHVQALKNGQLTYSDPVTGYQVMSRLSHLQRGECCGNACRHCPFGQQGTPPNLRRKYNSAFYE